jgi:predicted enzyme related to lactoylglutathione lyase
MPRPIHFEIPAENPERLMAFYQTVLGWTFQKWEGGGMPYWMITTGADSEPGINGGLMPRQNAQQPCVNTVGVANLDETLAAAVANGAQVALPRMAVPGVGWLAYILDPEGHLLGMMQMDSAAQ